MRGTWVVMTILAMHAGGRSLAQSGPPLAGDRPAPIVLDRPEQPGSPIWPSVLAGAAAAGLVGAAWALWRRAEAGEPADAAFRRMSRLLRLSATERRLVRVLARAHGVASPAALLLSGHAMRQAYERSGDARRRPALARLMRKLEPPAP